MAGNPQGVADELERGLQGGPAAFRAALGSLYAAQVELRHEPPLPVDGTVDGRRLAGSSDKEAAAISTALSDQRYGGTCVEVAGDHVTVRTTLHAALPDGRAVALPSHMELRVTDGEITAITHVMGRETMRAWAEVAVAGGMTGVERLLEDR